MHVSSKDLWVSRRYGPWKDISISVVVDDGNGILLSGVSVTLELQLPDGSIRIYTGTTDSNGKVTFSYTKASSVLKLQQ